VHVLEAFEYLVDNVLLVDVLENVGADDRVQVCVHEVEDQVDVSVVLGADHVLQPDDVLVPSQLLQEDDFTEGALCVRGVLEGVEVLFKRDDLLGALVDGLPDNAVGALA
jgi:hypothetical protein